MGREDRNARRSSEEDGDEDDEEDEDEGEMSGRDSALLLARDVAIAVILVLVVLAAIFAYTQVWPPMVVVESASMQHSDTQSYLGVIDTGDLVLVQRAPEKADVVTWAEGKVTGYQTYGDFGDVIVFHPQTFSLDSTPIIHRPIVYAIWNENRGGWDVPALENPALAGLWQATNETGVPLLLPRAITGSLILHQLGFRGVLSLTINFRSLNGSAANRVDGYITKGDHNSNFDGWGIVPQSRVVGKARGELPWFGLLKLLVSPGSKCCPSWGFVSPDHQGATKNAWDSLTLTLVLLPIGLYLADAAYAFGEDQWKWWKRSRGRGREARGGPEQSSPERGAGPPGPDGKT